MTTIDVSTVFSPGYPQRPRSRDQPARATAGGDPKSFLPGPPRAGYDPGMSGTLVILDGPDGCGKSTQANLLATRLQAEGRGVEQVRDPGGTVIGDRIRGILLDPVHTAMGVRTELLLYLASRAQLVTERIEPALTAGRDVICDRYLTATVAYQGYAGGLDPDWIWDVGRGAVGGPDPDLCVLLDLDAAESLGRAGTEPDRMEARGVVFQERVREGFRLLATDGPWPCALVSASGSPENVAERIWKRVSRVLR
jgi:dTMP kinase